MKSLINKLKLEDKIKLLTNTAIWSGVFCVIIALLLLLNYAQIKKSEPIESKALTALIERLAEEPNNAELKEEIRDLDLMARKAYFNNQWQIKTGALLLLIGAIIFLLALRLLNDIRSKVEIPAELVQKESFVRKISQRWILVAAALFLLLSFSAAWFTNDYLKVYDTDKIAVAEMAVADDPDIEVVEVDDGSAPVETTVPVDSLSQEEVAEADSSKQVPETEQEVASEIVEEVAPQTYPTLADIRRNNNTFRGPLGNGVSFRVDIPVEWDGAAGTNVQWKVAAPKSGYNSPVTWGNNLFITSATKQSQVVYCYNRFSGALLWQKATSGIEGSPASPPKTSEDTGLAAPTLCTDGIRVYAIFASGDIAAFDMNGNQVWGRNLGVPDNHYGHSSSLISWQEKLFVQYDTNKGGKVMALNCETGETIWDTKRSSKISWASPILASVGGKMTLVLSATPIVAAYDTETGTELWKVDCMMGEVGPSPAYGDGLIFAANEYATLAAINPSSGAIVWQDDEYLPEVSSPVVSDGLLFIATSYGVLACYDAKRGDKYWEHECDQGFYASPVIADGKLFAMDMDGVMHIFEVNMEKKLIGEPELGEKAMATPAFANKRIYIRGEEHLYCIGVN